MPSIGYGCVGLVILYSISPTDLVVIYDSKMYKSNPLGQYYVSCNEEDVIELNSLQYVSAEKVLLGDSSSFPTLHDELVEARSNSRNRKTVTKLGTDDNQLLIMGMRQTYYRCKLSFTHINHALNIISGRTLLQTKSISSCLRSCLPSLSLSTTGTTPISTL